MDEEVLARVLHKVGVGHRVARGPLVASVLVPRTSEPVVAGIGRCFTIQVLTHSISSLSTMWANWKASPPEPIVMSLHQALHFSHSMSLQEPAKSVSPQVVSHQDDPPRPWSAAWLTLKGAACTRRGTAVNRITSKDLEWQLRL